MQHAPEAEQREEAPEHRTRPHHHHPHHHPHPQQQQPEPGEPGEPGTRTLQPSPVSLAGDSVSLLVNRL